MTDPNPLFSVVIPTYNRAAKVVRALESVLAQTWKDYDVWVVDDGSTDQTAEALAPYLDRIHYRQIPNSGAAGARNQGIQESRGSYIALLDSDDTWRPTKLEAFAGAIQAHPEAGLLYSSIEVVDEAGQWLRVNQARAMQGSAYLPLLMGNFLAASSCVIRRACLEGTAPFDPAMAPCEDWDLWLRIARGCPIEFVPGALTRFEYTAADKITSNTAAWLEAHDRVVAKAFRLDPSLTPQVRQAVLAQTAVTKGRICLEAGDERQALSWFNQAAALRPTLLKAQVFRLLCAAPGLRRALPAALLRRLHLPENKGRDR
jgi:glycosyltransferase involved in cell wall biosynthesis